MIVMSNFANQKGQSLMQVVISIGMISILSTVFASMMESQNKQIKFLESKQEVVDAKNVLLRIYGGSSVSGCAAANTTVGDLTFPADTIPSVVSFNKIFDSSTDSLPYASIAGGFQGGMLIGISGMSFQNFKGSGNNYSGDLLINISQKNSNHAALKPITISNIRIITQDVGSNKKIISCNQSAPIANAFKTYDVTVNDINNGGGSPCHDLCSSQLSERTLALTACAKRYCVALGLGYVFGATIEFQCASGIGGPAIVACAK